MFVRQTKPSLDGCARGCIPSDFASDVPRVFHGILRGREYLAIAIVKSGVSVEEVEEKARHVAQKGCDKWPLPRQFYMTTARRSAPFATRPAKYWGQIRDRRA